MNRLKKITVLLFATGITLFPVAGKEPAPPQNHDTRNSFKEFRQGILSDYKNFRKRLLDQYADFLDGEWHEYESLKGEVRDKTPKPRVAPTVGTPSAGVPPVKPAPDVPAHPDKPEPVKTPVSTPESGNGDEDSFSFYGIGLQIPKIDFRITRRLASPSDYAQSWRELESTGIKDSLLPHLEKTGKDMNLNDYLLFRLVESYADAKFADADPSSRFSLIHYLLANMGYDVRIAVSTSGTPLLLLPFNEKIYARTYMSIEGERYYAFAPDEKDMERTANEGIRTCRLPSDAKLGNKFELRLNDLKIPEKPKSFKLEYGPLSLKGEVNENLMPILYNYPQMPVEDFALSVISPGLRESLVSQIKSQLAALPGDEKVEALLKFMHNVFEYSTDQDYHGFEKPYFIEETLFYPKNDCEDRAIFYTWFLWNALGRDAQLITFPGHESATVVMEQPINNGTSYTFGGKRFYVSDPTFIGSSTGMIMPDYRGQTPQVDHTYNNGKPE